MLSGIEIKEVNGIGTCESPREVEQANPRICDFFSEKRRFFFKVRYLRAQMELGAVLWICFQWEGVLSRLIIFGRPLLL